MSDSATVPVLDGSGKLPQSVLPAVTIGETFSVTSQAAMLALSAQNGDVAVRTDQSNRRYLLTGGNPALSANWVDLGISGQVDSVNGRTGAVVLDMADVGLSNVDNTSDANKPVSTAQQAALDLKVNRTDGAVNVRWFGAVGDGSNDDRPHIQAAIDAAITSRKKAVYLPGGTYRIGGTLLVRQSTGLTLFGDGVGRVPLPSESAGWSGRQCGTTIVFDAPASPEVPIWSFDASDGTATAGTQANHNLVPNELVQISGASEAFNGTRRVVATPTPTSFTFLGDPLPFFLETPNRTVRKSRVVLDYGGSVHFSIRDLTIQGGFVAGTNPPADVGLLLHHFGGHIAGQGMLYNVSFRRLATCMMMGTHRMEHNNADLTCTGVLFHEFTTGLRVNNEQGVNYFFFSASMHGGLSGAPNPTIFDFEYGGNLRVQSLGITGPVERVLRVRAGGPNVGDFSLAGLRMETTSNDNQCVFTESPSDVIRVHVTDCHIQSSGPREMFDVGATTSLFVRGGAIDATKVLKLRERATAEFDGCAVPFPMAPNVDDKPALATLLAADPPPDQTRWRVRNNPKGTPDEIHWPGDPAYVHALSKLLRLGTTAVFPLGDGDGRVRNHGTNPALGGLLPAKLMQTWDDPGVRGRLPYLRNATSPGPQLVLGGHTVNAAWWDLVHNPTALTVGAWVRLATRQQQNIIFSCLRPIAMDAAGFELRVNTSGYLEFVTMTMVGDPATQSATTTTSTTGVLEPGQWHHVQATWAQNGTVKLYVDGVPQAVSPNDTAGPIRNTANVPTIGSRSIDSGTPSFLGDIQLVYVHRGVFGDTVTAAIHSAGRDGR